jgi:hypothetical protein
MLNPAFFFGAARKVRDCDPRCPWEQAFRVPDEYIWYTGVILMISTYLEDAPANRVILLWESIVV